MDAEGRVGKRTWKRKGQEDVEDEGGRVMVDAGREQERVCGRGGE